MGNDDISRSSNNPNEDSTAEALDEANRLTGVVWEATFFASPLNRLVLSAGSFDGDNSSLNTRAQLILSDISFVSIPVRFGAKVTFRIGASERVAERGIAPARTVLIQCANWDARIECGSVTFLAARPNDSTKLGDRDDGG